MLDLVFKIVLQVLVWCDSLWFLGIANLLFEIVMKILAECYIYRRLCLAIKLLEMFLKILGYKLIRNVFYIMLSDTIFIQLSCWFSFPFSFYREIETQNLYINVQTHFFLN